MQPIEYLHLQMGLEGIGLKQNRLMTGHYPQSDDIPLVIIAQTSDEQTVTYYSEALSVQLLNELTLHANEIRFPNVEGILKVLRSYDIQPEVGHFRTYVFPEQCATVEVGAVKCFSKDDPKVKHFGFDRLADNVYAIEHDGVILSACVSTRQNAKCAEAWVFTAPEHRRKGLAQSVVTAWAKSLLHDGIVPFYSRKVENVASAKLANSLGLIPVFEEIGITEKKSL